MNAAAWIRFAVELAIDLATGALEKRSPPAQAPGMPHAEVERIRQAQLGHWVHSGATQVWCRGPSDPYPHCRRCVPRGRDSS